MMIPGVVAIGVATSVVGALVVKFWDRMHGAKSVADAKQAHRIAIKLKLDPDLVTYVNLKRKNLTPEEKAYWLARTAENPKFSPGGKYGDALSGADDEEDEAIGARIDRLCGGLPE